MDKEKRIQEFLDDIARYNEGLALMEETMNLDFRNRDMYLEHMRMVNEAKTFAQDQLKKLRQLPD
jgi:hypothetical protein